MESHSQASFSLQQYAPSCTSSEICGEHPRRPALDDGDANGHPRRPALGDSDAEMNSHHYWKFPAFRAIELD